MTRPTTMALPWFDRISAKPRVKGFVAGVTATASGTIAGACFVLARRAIVDVPTLVIGAIALAVAWRFRVPEPVLIAAAPRRVSSSSPCDRRPS